MSIQNERNQAIIDEFRANGGKVSGRFEGRTLLLLHTNGAKSHEARINPVAYVKDREQFVIIASKGGASTNPDWYYNTLADPSVSVEVGSEKFQVRANIAEEPEQTRLYDKMVQMAPGFAEYRQKTTRSIPVIVLTRIKQG